MENLDENNIQLGPQTSGWSKGSMGGRSSHDGERTSQNSGVNRYSLLSGDHFGPQMDSRRVGPGPRQQSHSMSGRDGRNMGGSMSQQLPMANQRPAGGYKGSISREHEQAIANVKNISNNNEGPRPIITPVQKPPTSSSSSRSSSVTRDPVKVGPPVPVEECNLDQLQTKIKNSIEEYLSVLDLNDAISNVIEYVPANKMSYFVTYLFNQFLEKSARARADIGRLLSELVKRNKLTVDQFWSGMNEIFEFADDMAIDIPKFWEYLAEIIAPLYFGGILYLKNVKESLEPLLKPRQTSVLLANILKVLSVMSPNGAPNLWRNSGLRLNQFVPVDEIESFISRHELQFLQDEVRSAAGQFISKEKIIEGLKQELVHVCADGSEPSGLDKIFNWIQDHISEQQQKDATFIRALVTAIVDQSIHFKEPASFEVKQESFALCCTVIKRYVDNKDSLELETLFALQSCVHKLEHPKGLLNSFFHLLYENEVVSEDGFLSWKTSEGQEVEGHAVAVKAVNTFLNNLKQSEDDDESA